MLGSMGSRHVGFSSCGAWASVVVARGLQSAGSVVVAHGLSCPAACGIFPDQDSNPCGLPWQTDSFFFFFFLIFIYYLFIMFIFGCVGSSFLCEGFPQLRRVGATLHRGARASHHRGLSRCGAEVPDAQAQQLRLTGPVAPWHVASSQTRARTRVPCIGRQTLNHCATREARQTDS